MVDLSDEETEVCNFYQNLWSNPKKIGRDKNLFLGWHLGYYEKGIKSYKEALINMNTYAGKLLDLNKNMNLKILDAGCGVGATLIQLASDYPNSDFYGITLTPNEIKIGEKLKNENNLNNVNFSRQSYNNTDFPNENFDGVYSLESVCYAEDAGKYIGEMNRILKKNGKLVVIDFFCRNDSAKTSNDKIIYKILKEENNLTSNNFLFSEINTFKKLLSEHGFRDIKVYDLLANRNVKKYMFYGFLFISMFYRVLKHIKKKNMKKKQNILFLPYKFLNNFIFNILIEIYLLKLGYFSIVAVK
jgi:ubiquinone/menaquinone biosynthesis C-methylase UbiE